MNTGLPKEDYGIYSDLIKYLERRIEDMDEPDCAGSWMTDAQGAQILLDEVKAFARGEIEDVE